MMYDKPIVIQQVDEKTERWKDLYHCHARINKSNGSEFLGGGAVRSKSTRTFEVRYFKGLEAIDIDRGSYRIVYRGNIYDIQDYDDYHERHKTVKLLGVVT